MGSAPTCLCTRGRLSEDISSPSAAVRPALKNMPAAHVSAAADEFMLY